MKIYPFEILRVNILCITIICELTRFLILILLKVIMRNYKTIIIIIISFLRESNNEKLQKSNANFSFEIY